MTIQQKQQLVKDLVGSLSSEELARMGGCTSPIRLAARDLIGDRHLPDLPPADEDVSLRCAANDLVRRQGMGRRQLARQRGRIASSCLSSSNVVAVVPPTPRLRLKK